MAFSKIFYSSKTTKEIGLGIATLNQFFKRKLEQNYEKREKMLMEEMFKVKANYARKILIFGVRLLNLLKNCTNIY